MEGVRPKDKNPWPKRVVVLIGLAIVAFAGTITTLNMVNHGGIDTQMAATQHSVGFALYRPKPMPVGFTLAPDGAPQTIEGNMVHMSYINLGKKIAVTQQQRPKMMEEVNKTKEWSTPIGSAYLAELNNVTVGFIVAESTLLIFSSPDKVEGDRLVPLMNAMATL